MTSDQPSILRFADVEFDVRAGELRRGDVRTRLEPQPARVLAVLVERAGDVVSRAELQQRVWSGDTFVDFERGLNYCIAQIRTALGDSASDPRFIETLPRRGYRFVAPVLDLAAPSSDTKPGERAAVPVSRGRQRTLIGAAALAVILVAAWMVVVRRPAANASQSARVRIAVALFDNETGVAEYDRLAESLTDATVARLASDPARVAVIGNAPILREPRGKRSLTDIGTTLGVGHVVLGQIQQIGGHLRITTHLIRAGDHTHVWARRFEPTAAETSTLDREVSEAVAAAVATRLLGG